MSKFIVTGSEGFIGKALVAFLVAKGHEVIGIDRKNGDEASDLDKFLTSNEDVKGVFHLAAQTSVFNPDTEQIRRDNIDTFITVCAQCASRDVRLVYASSSTAAPGNATSMYGLSKRFDEQYARLYNDEAYGVRLHNVYGPDPRQGTLLWHLMNDDVVDLYDMGGQTRHFTHIDDAVNGLYQVMTMKEDDDPILDDNLRSFRKLFNVANPEKLDVDTFAKEVSARNGVKLRYLPGVRERDNLHQRVEDQVIWLSLHYKTVQEGLDAILGKKDGERTLRDVRCVNV